MLEQTLVEISRADSIQHFVAIKKKKKEEKDGAMLDIQLLR